MPAADGLSADMAHKAHVKAINRDYILEPRLGEGTKLYSLNALCFLPALPRIQHQKRRTASNYFPYRRLQDNRRCQRAPGHCRLCQGLFEPLGSGITGGYGAPSRILVA